MSITPDEFITKMMCRIIDHIHPEHAELRYDGAPPYPLFGGQRFIIGNEYGRPRTLEDLLVFLGNKGYIDYVQWYPDWPFFQGMSFNDIPADMKYVSFGVRSYDSSIWVINPYLRLGHHQVGLAGTRFKGDNSDVDLDDPNVMHRHVVGTEDELFKKLIELIMAR